MHRLPLFALLLLILSGCVSVLDDVSHGVQPISSKFGTMMAAKRMGPSDPIMIRIFKQESELEVWKQDRSGRYALLKTYPICRWSGKLGPKKVEGDRQAPEGFYSVAAWQMNPNSQYNVSFNLGYPNKLERDLGYRGEALMVHGACTSAGCFALTDAGVSEIYAVAAAALSAGQSEFQVQSFPFRMTAANMRKYQSDTNFGFWENLKQGYDIFENTKIPPQVSSCGGKYAFGSGQTGEDCSRLPMLAMSGEKSPLDALSDPTVGSISVSGVTVYMDGGMHKSFRSLLKREGPVKMAKLVSLSAEPVSRPKAALADPYQ